MICQCCGIEAPTKYVSLHQNIGMLVMRQSRSLSGNLCKSCIHSNFWKYTLTNMFLGWWGTISFFVTPFFILNNVGRYLFCLTMPPVPPGASAPELTDDVVKQLTPLTKEIFDRMGQDEEFSEVAEDIARRTGVTPGQVAVYVRAVIDSLEAQEQ